MDKGFFLEKVENTPVADSAMMSHLVVGLSYLKGIPKRSSLVHFQSYGGTIMGNGWFLNA